MIERRPTLDSPNWPVPKSRASRLLRLLSFGLVVAMLTFLVLDPSRVLSNRVQLTQAVMPIALLGISGGLIYALGIAPRSGMFSTLVSPWATWPLMISSLAFLALNGAS